MSPSKHQISLEHDSRKTRITVDVGDMKVVKGAKGIVITHALGSCIGVTVYDPVTRIGGILHFMLPDSKISPAKAESNVFMFADTGIPELLRQAGEFGVDKTRMIVKLVGGGNVLDRSNYFNIGRKNYEAACKALASSGVTVEGELVGGTSGKTMRLKLETGEVIVRMPDGEDRTL